MFEEILNFYHPYVILYQNSLYAFLQNIQSLSEGLSSSQLATILYLYFTVFVCTPIINILAFFSVRIFIGWISLAVWHIPVALNLLGIYTPNLDVPDIYYIGDGLKYVGELHSTLMNVFIAFIFGWSLFILLVHIFRWVNFKDYYDHVWYLTGLVAIIIFVIESNSAFYREELQNSENELQQNVSLTISQLKHAKMECLKNTESLSSVGISPKFCEGVDWMLARYLFISQSKSFTRKLYDEVYLKSFVPSGLVADIDKYNKFQCSDLANQYCDTIFWELVRYDVTYDSDSRIALGVVPLNKSLIIFWEISTKLNAKIEATKRSPNLRWFFYLIFGFVLGGKVSTATMPIAGKPQPIFKPFWLALIQTLYAVFKLPLRVVLALEIAMATSLR